MSSDVLVSHAREAARSSDWSSLSHYLRRISMTDTFSTPQPLDQGLGRLPDHPSSGQSQSQISEVIDLALYALQSADFQTRWDLAKLIPAFGVGAIAPLSQLIDPAIDDDDWELLWFVARILGEFRTPETVHVLSQLMAYADQPDLVGVVIQAFANIGELAIPTLSQFLTDEATRLAAVQALSQMNHRSATEVLLQVSHDANPEIRALAISAIGHMYEPRIRQVLTQSLEDVSAQVRCAAVQGLGIQAAHMNEQDFLKIVEPLLWDIDTQVRRQTIRVLGRLSSSAAADHLNEALRSAYTPASLQADIIHALIWTETEAALQHLHHFVESRDVSVDAIVQPASTALSEKVNQAPSPSSPVYCEIAATLGQVRQSALKALAAQILTQMIETCTASEGHAVLKQNIAFSLGQLALPMAIAPLEQLLNDNDPRVRLHAAAALKMT
ncbi:MAG: HEAT repeat domain-containing protein [Elainellaceae cyanobacterium]